MVLKNRGLLRHGLTAVMYRGFETVKSPGYFRFTDMIARFGTFHEIWLSKRMGVCSAAK